MSSSTAYATPPCRDGTACCQMTTSGRPCSSSRIPPDEGQFQAAAKVSLGFPGLHRLIADCRSLLNEHRTVWRHLRSHSSRTRNRGPRCCREVRIEASVVYSRRYTAAQAEDADPAVLSSLRHGCAGAGGGEGVHTLAVGSCRSRDRR